MGNSGKGDSSSSWLYGDRFMLVVIFANVFCTVTHLLKGEWSAGLGWAVGTLWSVKCHGLSLRLRGSESGSETETGNGRGDGI